MTGQFGVWLENFDSSRYFTTSGYTINTADTWEHKTITIPGDTGGSGFGDDNGTGMKFRWHLAVRSSYQGTPSGSWSTSASNRSQSSHVNLASSTANEWYLTGVQIEVGEKATAFEHKRFDQELTDCCRYYQKSYQYGTAPGTVEDNGAICRRSSQGTTMSQHMGFEFRHRFRANPTVTIYSPQSGTASQVSNRGSAPTTHNSNVNVGSIFNIGQIAVSAMELSSSTGPAILYHYEADAEL